MLEKQNKNEEEEEKRIYFTISLYNLKTMMNLPKQVHEIILYLKQTKPGRWDYDKIIKDSKDFWEKHKSLLR